MAHFDYSTLNTEKLQKRPVYKKPPSYTLQDDPGNGCAGDPPGYPTYFTRSVYTRSGNTPNRGVNMVLTYQGVSYVIEDASDWDNCDSWDVYNAKISKRLRNLYKPLPMDHPRVQAWITDRFRQFKHCYYDPTLTHKIQDLVIYPVPSYRLFSFKDDERFSDEWREKEKAAIDQKNDELIAAVEKIAVYDNHAAVVQIRKYYPEFNAPIEDYENLPHPGNWWERYAHNFTPETCPGQYGHKHPVNGGWCQMCGLGAAE